jgi:hypothetical protein
LLAVGLLEESSLVSPQIWSAFPTLVRPQLQL